MLSTRNLLKRIFGRSSGRKFAIINPSQVGGDGYEIQAGQSATMPVFIDLIEDININAYNLQLLTPPSAGVSLIGHSIATDGNILFLKIKATGAAARGNYDYEFKITIDGHEEIFTLSFEVS
jgi:hypothetical protein